MQPLFLTVPTTADRLAQITFYRCRKASFFRWLRKKHPQSHSTPGPVWRPRANAGGSYVRREKPKIVYYTTRRFLSRAYAPLSGCASPCASYRRARNRYQTYTFWNRCYGPAPLEHSSKATATTRRDPPSPFSAAGMRLMPTSITVAPGLTLPACTKSGRPTATTRVSELRQTSAKFLVRERAVDSRFCA